MEFHVKAVTDCALARAIRQIEGLDLVKGPWVAGGAARRLFQGKSLGPGDIDVFTAAGKPWIDTAIQITDIGKHLRTENAGASVVTQTQEFEGQDWKFQTIGSKTFDSVEALFCTFDFTICQFATDGRTIIYTPEAEEHVRRGQIVLRPGVKAKRTSVLRLAKYVSYGFNPSPGVLEWTLRLDCAERTGRKHVTMMVDDDEY